MNVKYFADSVCGAVQKWTEVRAMKTQQEIIANKALVVHSTGEDGGAGWIYLNGASAKPAAVIWSFGEGWEHVSVSHKDRCPTWEEMCKVKDLFFNPEEVVVQFHPRQSEYVNVHPHCLHLWRKSGEDFDTPPVIYV